MINLYFFLNKEIEITFKICLIFMDKKLSTIKFYKVNYTYTASQNNHRLVYLKLNAYLVL